jgi:chemotaxis protein methyltransferase CheR
MSPDDCFLCDFLHKRAGIVLDDSKTYLLEARLATVGSRLGRSSTRELVRAIRRDPSGPEATAVVEALTTNETSFFRDGHPFELLRRHVMPSLVRERERERALRIWSAACSTGQEAYSIAMLLRDDFPELTGWDVRILATDLVRGCVDHARAGRYRLGEVQRGLTPALLARHFRRDGDLYVVVDELKQRLDARVLNLLDEWEGLPRFDVIFLRNVLIYFDDDTKQRVLTRARTQLRPGGWLFLGGADSRMAGLAGLERVPLDGFFCHRRPPRSTRNVSAPPRAVR